MLPSIRVVSTSAGTPIDRELRHGAKMNKRGAETFDLTADVLVVGGGPAAAWAAIAASEAGARVILVDKGYVGTSGATAPANTGTWSPPPGEPRRAAIDARLSRAGGLADPEWIEHTIGMAWDKLHCLADWGYPFPIDDNGEVCGGLGDRRISVLGALTDASPPGKPGLFPLSTNLTVLEPTFDAERGQNSGYGSSVDRIRASRQMLLFGGAI